MTDIKESPLLAGTVLGVHIVAETGAVATPLREVFAVADRGLEGDRYYLGTGRYSKERQPSGRSVGATGTGGPVPPKRQLTFIAQESLDEMASKGVELSPAESRRNILTGGIELLGLIGRRFSVGEAVCEGVEDCTPCSYLQSLTRPGVLRALGGLGGLRARILAGGAIRVGDSIVDLGPGAAGQASSPD